MKIEEINRLKHEFRLSNLLRYPKEFEIKLIGLTEEENINYDTKIKDYSTKCGCDMGRIFLISSLFGYLGLLVTFSVKFPSNNYILNCLCFSLVGAIIGKFYGLIKSNLEINKIISKVDHELRTPNTHLEK